MAAPVLLAVALIPTAGAETDADVRLSLAFGHDSNPTRLSGDGPGGGFTEARLDTVVDVELGRRVGLFFEADGRARLHESDRSDADHHSADLRAGFSVSPIRIGRARLSVAVGGLYRLHRSTFIDRETGRIYEMPVDPPTLPPTTTPIPDRFDSDTAGGLLELRLRPTRNLRLSLETRLENTDYLEDYGQTTALDPLDHRRLTVEPGVTYRLNGSTTLKLSLALTDLDFDRQPALDANGSEVVGTTRQYRYATYRVQLRLRPAEQWRLSVGLNNRDREDRFANYYDFGSWSGFVSLDRRVGEKTRFQAYVSTRRLDYDNAVVPGDPDGETRGSDVLRFIGRFDRKLQRRIGVFAEAGLQRTDSRDPIFAHDRDWVMTGIQFRR